MLNGPVLGVLLWSSSLGVWATPWPGLGVFAQLGEPSGDAGSAEEDGEPGSGAGTEAGSESGGGSGSGSGSGAGTGAEAGAGNDSSAAVASPGEAGLGVEEAGAEPSGAGDAGGGSPLAEALRERERLKPWHIVFGNLTWAAMNATVALGFLRFSDSWGWSGDPADTGCARGDPILGQELCSGTPVAHTVTATALTVFYGATFTIALFMPDPIGLAEGDSERATQLRLHRVQRWVLLGLLIAQVGLGAVTANVDFGDDFAAGRALATTHLVLGSVAWGAMTATGVLGSLLAW